jgi:hypothetical protein
MPEFGDILMPECCKGCYTFLKDLTLPDPGCAHNHFNLNGECPCTECIIKVMCSESCSDYDAFSKSAMEK